MQSSAGVCVCVLCGLPAAGKSTVTHLLSDHLHTLGWRNFIISYDQFISEDSFNIQREEEEEEEEESRRELTGWKQQRQKLLECVERFLQELSADGAPHTHTDGATGTGSVCERFQESLEKQQILTALQNTHTHTHTHSHAGVQRLVLLLDDNFYYHSMRHQVYQLARRRSVGFCEVYLRCSLEVCLHRNRVRGQPVSENVIIAMSNRMEPPDATKNQWEKNNMTVDNTHSITHTQLLEILQMISSAVENPLSPVQDDTEQREADRQRCASSVVHQVDQVCRKLITRTMNTARAQSVSSEEMRGLSRALSEEKSLFLQELRSQVLRQLGRDECVCVERLLAGATTTFTRRTHATLQQHFTSC